MLVIEMSVGLRCILRYVVSAVSLALSHLSLREIDQFFVATVLNKKVEVKDEMKVEAMEDEAMRGVIMVETQFES